MKTKQSPLSAPDRAALLELITRNGLEHTATSFGMSSTTLARVAVGSGCNGMTRIAVHAALAAGGDS